MIEIIQSIFWPLEEIFRIFGIQKIPQVLENFTVVSRINMTQRRILREKF